MPTLILCEQTVYAIVGTNWSIDMTLTHDLRHTLLNGDDGVAHDNCARCYHDADTGQAFDHLTRQIVDCHCGPGVTIVTVRIEPDSDLGLGYMMITDVEKRPCSTVADCGPMPCKTYLES